MNFLVVSFLQRVRRIWNINTSIQVHKLLFIPIVSVDARRWDASNGVSIRVTTIVWRTLSGGNSSSNRTPRTANISTGPIRVISLPSMISFFSMQKSVIGASKLFTLSCRRTALVPWISSSTSVRPMALVRSIRRMVQQRPCLRSIVQIGSIRILSKIILFIVRLTFALIYEQASHEILGWNPRSSERMMIAFSMMPIFQVRLPMGDSNTSLLHLIVEIRDLLNCVAEFKMDPLGCHSEYTSHKRVHQFPREPKRWKYKKCSHRPTYQWPSEYSVPNRHDSYTSIANQERREPGNSSE